jgi:hypothetical protein
MEIDTKHLFGNKLIKIWDEAAKLQIPYTDRGFRFPTNLFTDSILFVGINPSYNIGVSQKEFFNSFYSFNQQGKNHRYFKKFEDIARHTANHWAHIDLFFYQETAQKSFYEILENQNGKDFLSQQIQIAKELIIQIRPKLIVVANTLARDLMLKEHDLGVDFFDFKFNEELGTYQISDAELKDTPVFFTSMLTGQRALDNGSFERLKWHIKNILK